MVRDRNEISRPLNLRVGDVVVVRSRREILSTLDDNGCLEGLPFMPEMLEYCGRMVTVGKSAHKTCDTITKAGLRYMRNTVHLEDIRCNGRGHGDCEATCLIYWKEGWLKKIDHGRKASSDVENAEVTGRIELHDAADSGMDDLEALVTRSATVRKNSESAGTRYSCQITSILKASTPYHTWNVSHYLKDLSSGNVTVGELVKGAGIGLFNILQRWRGGRTYPFMDEKLMQRKSTPYEHKNLQAGDMVRIRPLDEILGTLDVRGKNRGLFFDREMVRYCGRTAKVLKRVTKIINESTGEMLHIPNGCVILEGVICRGDASYKRMFCPRGIYPFWREIWLIKL